MRHEDLIFSELQAVTSSAASTNQIKVGEGRNLADLYLVVQSKTAFTAEGSATMSVALRTDADSAMGSPTTVITYAALGKASYAANTVVLVEKLPPYDYEGYIDLYYTVATGPMTAGTLHAFLTDSPSLQ